MKLGDVFANDTLKSFSQLTQTLALIKYNFGEIYRLDIYYVGLLGLVVKLQERIIFCL